MSQKIFIYPFQVEFDWVDAGNVMYHPNYFIVYERARAQALADSGYPQPELWKDGFALALAESSLVFKKPAWYGERLVVLTAVLESTRATLQVKQAMLALKDGDPTPLAPQWDQHPALVNLVTMRLACVNVQKIRPAALPDRLRQALGLA